MIAVLVMLAAILFWVLASRRLRAVSITAPIVLTVVGLLAAVSPIDAGASITPEATQLLIEVTLAVVLFVDASSIAVGWFRQEWTYPARMLGVGFPLTFVLGAVVALVMFAGVDPWVGAVIGAALAPTDAALGLAIVENEKIPLKFRQVINVESGLNDGLATPVVVFCIAMAAAEVDRLADRPIVSAVVDIAIGVAVGAAVGVVAGRATRHAFVRRWAEPVLLPIVPLAVAVGAYLLVVTLGGNGFVAAFVAGVAFGAEHNVDRATVVQHGLAAEATDLFSYVRTSSQLLGYAVWFVFGSYVLARIDVTQLPCVLVFAVLSLTVLRMLPVALSSIGLHLPWDTVLLAGWLGPRGLASIIFALMAAETIGGFQGRFVLEVVAVTVAISVLAHGLSAGPLAAWYARRHPVGPLEPATAVG